MEVKILHIYPDLMSLYGSYANLSVLRRYLEYRGYEVKFVQNFTDIDDKGRVKMSIRAALRDAKAAEAEAAGITE